MNHSEKDIKDLLNNWYKAKNEIAELEKKCDKYKKLAEKIMSLQGGTKLQSEYFTLTKRNMCRYQLSRQNVPQDIWQKYATKLKYPTYYLKKNKK